MSWLQQIVYSIINIAVKFSAHGKLEISQMA